MHACFVRAFWTRYRRLAGEIRLQTRSSNAHHLSRPRRHRQLRIPLGNTTRIWCSHTAGSGRRICSMWICSMADIITSLKFLWSGLLRCLHRPEQSAKNASARDHGVVHVLSRARLSPTISFTSIQTLFHSKPPQLRHPLSNSDGRQNP